MPLINVIFLLLIFFMVAGSVERLDTIEVSVPTAKLTDKKPSKASVIYLSQDGKVALNDIVVQKSQLRTKLLSMLKGDQSDSEITVKADRHLSAKELVWVMNLVEEAGGTKLLLVTEAMD